MGFAHIIATLPLEGKKAYLADGREDEAGDPVAWHNWSGEASGEKKPIGESDLGEKRAARALQRLHALSRPRESAAG